MPMQIANKIDVMKSVIQKFLAGIGLIFLALIACKHTSTGPSTSEWEFLGLEGKLVSELKLIEHYLYACAGSDGLYRFNLQKANAQWEYLGLADIGVGRTLESGVTDVIYANGSLLVSYVASYQFEKRGIYRSSDDGVTWFPSDSGMVTTLEYPTTSQVIRLQQHPSIPQLILAGTTVSLVYVSEDAGLSWRKLYGEVGEIAFNFSIRFNQRVTNEIWIGGETGFFSPYLLYSINLGQTWAEPFWFPSNIGPYTHDNAVYDIAIDPTDDGVLYFGMLGAIVKTTDKAKSFQRILGWDDGVYRHWRLALNPNTPREIFATGFYLYRTTDGWQTWQKIKPPVFEIYALAVDWQQRVVFVSVSSPENGIYKMQF